MLTADQIIQQLNWRYAVKQFDPTRKVTDAQIEKLKEILALTPSSFGLQPWKFIIIADQAVLDQLPAISQMQMQAGECSHMVVFAMQADYPVSEVATYVERMATVHQKPIDAFQGFTDYAAGFIQMASEQGWIDEWSAQQVYIALGQFMLALALLEIDGCPMAGIDPPAYDQLLGLDQQGYKTVVVCPIGYRHPDDKYASMAKVRFNISDIVETI